MSVLERLKSHLMQEVRSDSQISVDQWASYFTYLGSGYQAGVFPSTLYGNKKQEMPNNWVGLVEQMFMSNSIVFSCVNVRLSLFSDILLKWQSTGDGKIDPDEIPLLDSPWLNAKTSDLLARMLLSADLAGNFYATRGNGIVQVLRPDWVSIVLGSRTGDGTPSDEMDVEVAGYLYHPGGIQKGRAPQAILPENMCHFAPMPDPLARFRGMSWITPVIREIMADGAATDHKLRFFENGATPNLAVKVDPAVQADAFKRFVELFREQHEGVANAYKTMFLGGATDVTVVGANMRQIDFKTTQGAGETRIASAAGVPPIVAGFSEGLQSATYSNYGLAMRRFTDVTVRPLWSKACGALETLVDPPVGKRLWYDDRRVAALAESGKDRSEIQASQAVTLRQYVDAGFDPDSAVQAVLSGDISKLNHSGLFSVQLQPAGAVSEGSGSLVAGVPAPTQNGKGETPVPAPGGAK